MKKFLFSTCLTAILTSFCALPVFADEPIDVFVVGDSTACEYGSDDNYAVPRAGWGMYLQDYCSDKIKVTNLAMSGRSSKSFATEENYQTLLSSLGEGDYVLIQFGHNDAKNTKEEDIQLRYTEPSGDKDTEGSFKNSLYKNYIQPVQSKGAIPVLMTPISRRQFENGEVKDSHGLYDDAIRELADELDLALIDMTQITADLYNYLGEYWSVYMHAVYNSREKGADGIDNTHLNHLGARKLAMKVESEFVANTGLSLRDYTKFGKIYPDVSRGEFTEMLVRALQLDDENASVTFSDIKGDEKYAHAVAVAKAYGIVIGDENATFNGEREIKETEAILMAERCLRNVLKVDMPENNGITMEEQVKIASENLNACDVYFIEDNRIDLGFCNSEDVPYKMIIDLYNAETKAKKLSADKEQSIDEIEKTETVVLNK